jgi:hypothetical protein
MHKLWEATGLITMGCQCCVRYHCQAALFNVAEPMAGYGINPSSSELGGVASVAAQLFQNFSAAAQWNSENDCSTTTNCISVIRDILQFDTTGTGCISSQNHITHTVTKDSCVRVVGFVRFQLAFPNISWGMNFFQSLTESC